MKVYLEEKDIGRKITTYHDGLGTQQGLYVFGKDKIEILSLDDYTKQVRKEVCDEISWKLNRRLNGVVNGKYSDEFFNGYSYCSSDIENILDQIQGEING